MAGKIAHEALNFPWPWIDPIDELWPSIEAQTQDVDIDIRALREIQSWLCQHEHQFHGRTQNDNEVPVGGWLGHWSSATQYEFVGIFPHILKAELDRMKFDYGAVIQGWQDRGVVKHRKTRPDWGVKIDRKTWPVIAILRTALEALDDEEEEPVSKESSESARTTPQSDPLVSCYRCEYAPDNVTCKLRMEFSTKDHACGAFQQAVTIDQVESI